MKNLVPAIMATVIATTAFFNTHAQVAPSKIAPIALQLSNTPFFVTEEATNYINTVYKNSSTLSKASARALKDFAKMFKSPANTNWYDDGEGGFMAYFKDSTTSTHVDYNKRGNWVYTMAMYPGEQLPNNIFYDVKMMYPLHTINGVMEIHINSVVAYIIHIEDKKGYKTLRYTEEGGVEEIEDLLKYDPRP